VAGFELFAFIIGIIWVIFPLAVIHFMGKQREANRVIAQHLDAIRHEMEEMNKILKSANKMHGDLNKAAQWFVDRDTQASQKALSP